MSALIVNNILNQVNQQSNSKEIKKLLLYKLEVELNAGRCILTDPTPTNKDNSWVEIVNE